MVAIADHLSVDELDRGYRSAKDGTTARHYEVIRFLAKGHSTTQVAALSGFGLRWIEELVVRYNAFGPDSLGDLRRKNGKPASILTDGLLEALRRRLDSPPDDGGVWTSKKAAGFIATFHGLSSCSTQRTGRRSAHLHAALYARTAAGRNAVGPCRRTHRQQPPQDHRRT
ncbi:helix-turn-helix domain-containing protein [Martelella soudanensis]|uniref:helix-turn-helix domain-containing protein n=1 Tax=unclassified Martelella TaxID=2629616 RepID=UPI0015DF93AC|nr:MULTISPECIES: helix-turn-helix domain-containing protein [unclassified Martelella]